MIALPRLGMGTAPLGNLYRPMGDDQAAATLHAALGAGIAYFDTAPYYGFGLAEQRLGAALAGRKDVIISTKVGRLLAPRTGGTGERHGFVDARPFEPVFDYSYDGVMRSLESSLARLGLDRVQILLAHDLGRLTHGPRHDAMLAQFLAGGYPALRRLRDEGVVDAIGIGVNEVEICLDLIERIDLDVILLAGRYTLLDRTAADRLLPACVERGIQVVIGGPYNSGILARPLAMADEARFDYLPASAERLARAHDIESACLRAGASLPQAALHFALRHLAVAAVIPGMATPAEVTENVARMAQPVPPSLWHDLSGLAV